MSTVTSNYKRPTLALMAESPSFSGKKITHVLVSQHRGYIFIQTDQPIYNPTQKGKRRDNKCEEMCGNKLHYVFEEIC